MDFLVLFKVTEGRKPWSYMLHSLPRNDLRGPEAKQTVIMYLTVHIRKPYGACVSNQKGPVIKESS